MENRDTIEFYDGKKLIASIRSSMVPFEGAYININKVTWMVSSVTYALDNETGLYSQRSMRANVDLEKPE